MMKPVLMIGLFVLSSVSAFAADTLICGDAHTKFALVTGDKKFYSSDASTPDDQVVSAENVLEGDQVKYSRSTGQFSVDGSGECVPMKYFTHTKKKKQTLVTINLDDHVVSAEFSCHWL